MKWLFAAILIGITLTGCKSSAPVYDPFFGRTTIPPPPTGSVTGQGTDPYYQPPPMSPPPASSSVPPSLQPTPQPSLPAGTPAPPSMLPGPVPTTNSNTGTWTAPNPSVTAPANPVAPRPTSTLPSQPPMNSSPYLPPGGSFDNRGTSTQGYVPQSASPPTAKPASVSYTNVSATRSVAVGNDRMPRPIDDTAGQGSISGRKPIIHTLQPQGSPNASVRPVDISDLPKTP